jgi:uncharacterized membrane protein
MKGQSLAYALPTSHALLHSNRVKAIDIVRGFIMCLMALVHCQEYVGISRKSNLYWNDPLWQPSSLFDYARHLLISTVASGGFFFLMGIGVVFLWYARQKQGWALNKTLRYLLLRGLLLIILQFTVLAVFECLTEQKIFIYVGVLSSLGVCMIFASLLLFLIQKISIINYCKHVKYIIPVIIILSILSYNYLSVIYLVKNSLDPSIWQRIFLVGGKLNFLGIPININFTPLPWFSAVAFGLFMGHFIIDYKGKAWDIMTYIGLLFITVFILLRVASSQGFGSMGEYKDLMNTRLDIESLFSLTKYPPSICYYLWSLGINMTLLALLKKVEKYMPLFLKLFEPLQVFGKSALFFFVCHWFIYFGLSLLIPHPLNNTWTLLGTWVLGLMMLYYCCAGYYAFKIKKNSSSIWRMF